MFNKYTGQLLMLGFRHSLNSLAAIAPERAGHLAFELISIPRAGKDPFDHPSILNTAQQEDLILAGIRIRSYRWPGPGPRILLLHGWESNTSRWKSFIQALQMAGFDIMGIDAPGHGQSGGRKLTAVFYAQVIGDLLPRFQPNAVIGHSLGGMAAAYQLNRDRHYLPQQLILMGTPSAMLDLTNLYRSYLGLNDEVIRGMDHAFEKKYKHAATEFSIPDYAKKFDLPGLIVHDRQDERAPYEGAVAIHKNWRNAQLFTTNGLGHSLYGGEVVERVVSFLNTETIRKSA